jgi:hypothetical protein
MSILLQRARKEHSRSGYIETRCEHGTSLFLSWWTDHDGTLYQLRHGLYGGKVILKHFVPSQGLRNGSYLFVTFTEPKKAEWV